MSYKALYRQYRPKTFNEVAGQKVIIKTLQNSIKINKIGHAYLFNGPRGTGKTSVAKIFSKAVNCLKPKKGDACGKCSVCKGLDSGEIRDVIEIDAASNNSVDDIRALRERAQYTPAKTKYKVYIIDEVHMLTEQAFNALLKILEEPPKHVIFILATTEIQKIPLTILSRCQQYEFKNIDKEEATKRLEQIIKKEKITIEDEAIFAIIENAEGSLRDAIGILDQLVSYSSGDIKLSDVHEVCGSLDSKILIEIVKGIHAKDTNLVLTKLDKLIQNGKEETKIVNDLILCFRDILLTRNSKFKKEKYLEVSKLLNENEIYFYLDVLNDLEQDIKWTNQKRAYVELAFIKMMNNDKLDILELVNKVDILKQEIETLKKTKPSVIINQVENNQTEKIVCVTSDDINRILNNMIISKTDYFKNQFINGFPNNKSVDQLFVKMLKESNVCAVSKNEILLSNRNIKECERFYKKGFFNNLLNLIQTIDPNIENFKIISNKSWRKVEKEYNEQKKKGLKQTKIPEMDYNLYIEKPVSKQKPKSKFEKSIKNIFGDVPIVEE